MRGGLTGEAAAVVRRRAGLGALAFLPLAWAMLWGDGSRDVRLAWIGLASLVALAVLAWLAPWPRLGRDALLLLGGLGALIVWQGVSLLWSIEGDRTWDT